MKEEKKVRVLHCIGKMNCGGAETMLMTIYRQINKEIIQFDFLTHAKGMGCYDEEIIRLGGRINQIPSQGTVGIFRYIKVLRKFLKENGPFDVVHAHLDWQGGMIAVAARLAGVKKVIVHAHTSKLMNQSLAYQIILRLQKVCIGIFATDYWACSREASRFLFYSALCPSAKQKIIPNAINLECYKGIDRKGMRKLLGVDEDTLLIGHVGSLSPFKNQIFLIEVAKQLQKQKVKFKLILVGTGQVEYKCQVEKKIKAYGLQEQIELLGLREDIPSIMTALDIFVLPSLFEGLGIVAIEAQAAGVPCLVSVGVPREVDMGLGLVDYLPQQEVERWAEAIRKSKKNRRVDLQTTYRAITECNYNIHQVITQLENEYMV